MVTRVGGNGRCKYIYIYRKCTHTVYIIVSVCTCTSRMIKTNKSIAVVIISLFSCCLFQTDSDEDDDIPAAKTLAPSKVSLVRVE